MLYISLRRWFKPGCDSNRRGRNRGNRPDRRASFVPRLLVLDDRTLPSALTVLTNADSGDGSLRAAIAAAQSGDQIVFDPGLRGQSITLTSGELAISKDLDIEGPGADQLTVSGNGASRVFDITGGVTVTISGLKIAHGRVVGSSTVGVASGGGGILNEAGASLTLTHCRLTDNQAVAAAATVDVFGGGLLNEGSATVTYCTFNGNEALGGGGSSFSM